MLAVRTVGDALYGFGVTFDFTSEFAVSDIPEADGLVEAARRQRRAIRAEGNAVDDVGVPFEFAKLLTVGEAPKLDGIVEAAGRQPLPVGTDGQAVDESRMPFKFFGRLSRGHEAVKPHNEQAQKKAEEHRGFPPKEEIGLTAYFNSLHYTPSRVLS